jgi:hypothetical protein
MATLIGVNPTNVVLSGGIPEFRLGTIAGVDNPTLGYQEFIYGRTAAAITGAGYVCVEQTGPLWQMVDSTIVAAGGLGGPGSRCGIAMGAMASGDYGWFQIYGRCSIRTAAAAAKGTKLYPTATAGAVGTTAAAASIEGLTLLTATGGAATGTDGEANLPHIGLVNGAALF